MSGRRVKEILHLRKKDLVFSNNFLRFITFNEKCFRSKPQSDYSIHIGERYYEKIQVDFSMTSEAYKELGEFITNHLQTLGEEDYLFQRQKGGGHIGRDMAYKIVRFLCPGIWPHWLRHQRFSMVTEQLKNLPTADLIYSLKDFTKHHRTDSTLTYIHRMQNIEIKRTI